MDWVHRFPNMKARFVSFVGIGVMLVALSSVPVAANAAPPSVINHSQSGCGEQLTLHTPAPGTKLTAAALGERGTNTVLAEAARHNVRWLSSVTCKSRSYRPAALRGSNQVKSTGGPYLNWSGYVADTTYSPNYVQGFWTEPDAALPAGVNSAVSSIWPGLGGDGKTAQLVQDGTVQLLNGSGSSYTEQHYFWFEVWPQEGMQEISNLIPNAGDQVAADTSWFNGTANFALCDYTQGQCVTGSQSSPAPTDSAEWIVERPTLDSGYAPLPNFGTVTFSNGGYQESANGSLEYNIASGGGQPWDMENTSNQIMASPGGLTNGNTFSDTWHRVN